MFMTKANREFSRKIAGALDEFYRDALRAQRLSLKTRGVIAKSIRPRPLSQNRNV